MGFTFVMTLIYLALILLTLFLFKCHKRIFAYALIALMVIGLIVMAYLWFTSPM